MLGEDIDSNEACPSFHATAIISCSIIFFQSAHDAHDTTPFPSHIIHLHKVHPPRTTYKEGTATTNRAYVGSRWGLTESKGVGLSKCKKAKPSPCGSSTARPAGFTARHKKGKNKGDRGCGSQSRMDVGQRPPCPNMNAHDSCNHTYC
jgi:hypothetical protein